MGFRLILSLVFMLPACDPSESVPSGTYAVKSDCEGFSAEGTLAVENNSIFGPGEHSQYDIEGATEFGFPSNSFAIQGPHLIQSANDDRICKTVVFENSTEYAMFACMDRSEQTLLCTIFMERQ